MQPIFPPPSPTPMVSPLTIAALGASRVRRVEYRPGPTPRADEGINPFAGHAQKARYTAARMYAIPNSAVQELLTKSRQCLERMKRGGTPRDWGELSGMVATMLSIQTQGVIRVDPMPICKAWDALAAVQARHCDLEMRQWTPIEMRAPEIAALENAIDHSGAQMLHLRQDEFLAAVRRGMAWNDEALNSIARKVRKQAMGDS